MKQLLGDLFVGRILSQICQNFVVLETTARDAEAESFLDLTSGDGEWFLADDIHMQVKRVKFLYC